MSSLRVFGTQVELSYKLQKNYSNSRIVHKRQLAESVKKEPVIGAENPPKKIIFTPFSVVSCTRRSAVTVIKNVFYSGKSNPGFCGSDPGGGGDGREGTFQEGLRLPRQQEGRYFHLPAVRQHGTG